MSSNPLLWIVGLAIVGLLLVAILASATHRTHEPLERDRINKATDKAAKKNGDQ